MSDMMRIHSKALALSCGIVFGGVILIKTLAGFFFGYGLQCLEIIETLYPGYDISAVGSVIGFLYGFLTGGIIGGFIGVIYNRIFVRL